MQIEIAQSLTLFWTLPRVICPCSPRYLGPFTLVADLPSRRSLHSVGTNRLVVPTSRLSTAGSRAFPVAGPQTWNDLPEDVTSAESLTTFRRLLNTHLFRKSFPDYLLDINLTVCDGLSSSSDTYCAWTQSQLIWVSNLPSVGAVTPY